MITIDQVLKENRRRSPHTSELGLRPISKTPQDEYEGLEKSICKLTKSITIRTENPKLLDLLFGVGTGLFGYALENEHIMHVGERILRNCEDCE